MTAPTAIGSMPGKMWHDATGGPAVTLRHRHLHIERLRRQRVRCGDQDHCEARRKQRQSCERAGRLHDSIGAC
jgi:hypothetical protein